MSEYICPAQKQSQIIRNKYSPGDGEQQSRKMYSRGFCPALLRAGMGVGEPACEIRDLLWFLDQLHKITA